MINQSHQYGLAWMLYSLYESFLWPLSTFLMGLEDQSLFWAFFGALPIYIINFSLDRQRQKQKEKPATILNSTIVITITIFGALLILYYLGFTIGHFVGTH